jgi:glutamate---cysteine ligase / carboxylate-amine ligase
MIGDMSGLPDDRPTIGVEEEFHIVDPATGDVVPAARQLLRRADDEADHELQRSLVETASGVHTTLADLRGDLLARRRDLADAAGQIGLAVATVGTVPDAGSRPGQIFPDPRYEWMADEYRQLVAEQQVCACQVHVGVPDRDLAVRVIGRIRPWLPTLLALSGSSPCFQGADTGYASYRTVVTSRWPTVGPPPDFTSADDYDHTVATLVDSGVISDAGMIYFDARLSARYPTIEIRIADACPSIDDALVLAAVARGLVVTAVRADHDATGPDRHHVLLRAATWRAARSGLDGQLIDPETTTAVPAADLVHRLLAHVRPVLEEYDDWAEVASATQALLARGSSAQRQRAALRAGRSTADLVAALATETTAG